MSSWSVSWYAGSNHTEIISFPNKFPGLRALKPWVFMLSSQILLLTNSCSYIKYLLGETSSKISVFFPSLYFSKAVCSHFYDSKDLMVLQTTLYISLSRLCLPGSIFESLGLDTWCSFKACKKYIRGTDLWFPKHGQLEQNYPSGFLDADLIKIVSRIPDESRKKKVYSFSPIPSFEGQKPRPTNVWWYAANPVTESEINSEAFSPWGTAIHQSWVSSYSNNVIWRALKFTPSSSRLRKAVICLLIFFNLFLRPWFHTLISPLTQSLHCFDSLKYFMKRSPSEKGKQFIVNFRISELEEIRKGNMI